MYYCGRGPTANKIQFLSSPLLPPANLVGQAVGLADAEVVGVVDAGGHDGEEEREERGVAAG